MINNVSSGPKILRVIIGRSKPPTRIRAENIPYNGQGVFLQGFYISKEWMSLMVSKGFPTASRRYFDSLCLHSSMFYKMCHLYIFLYT